MNKTWSASAAQPSPADALARLMAGNARYAANVRSIDSLVSQMNRAALVAKQHPFAVIFGCSDARAPAEVIFDQGLGDLFVIRVVGQVVDESSVGSIEFACELLNVPLVLVLGHSHCGAVGAAIDEVREHEELPSENLLAIVRELRPPLEALVRAHRDLDHDALSALAVPENVRANVRKLTARSPLLARRVAAGTLKIVGAELDIATGKVVLVDGDG